MSTTAILRGELYHESEETVLIRRALMEAAMREHDVEVRVAEADPEPSEAGDA
jgi:hypothetical protein